MAHGKPVAYRNGIELQRRPSRGQHPIFYRPGDLIEVRVAGNYLIKGIDNADKRFFNLPVRQPASLNKAR